MVKIKILKEKKAWIRIVEAFTMILLITGILLVVLNKEDLLEDKSSKNVYEKQQEILRKIQLNNTLRENILTQPALPVEWDNFPSGLKDYIISETPSYIECKAKICSLSDSCVLNEVINDETNLYVQKTIISATLDTYNPRQLKIFCWER